MDEENRLPERIFAAGHEPPGERVNSYHKSKRIESILKALDGEEVAYLQESPFGTVLRTAEVPAFSGSFAHYLIGKLLRVQKKHEIWFLYVGRPIRFSLREFAIVTGLNCGKLPNKNSKKKRRNPVKEKLYWPELFGTLKTCTVDKVIDMLEKKTVKDKETRLKFACLAITSAVLMPTSHFPKIISEHVELIRDLQEFFKYPWGRAAFDVLMANLKAKDEIALSQSTVAIRSFVHSIQLVMVAAVPALMEVVQLSDSGSCTEYGSESDEGHGEPHEEGNTDVSKRKEGSNRPGLSPGHARILDDECKVDVQSIIGGESIGNLSGTDLSWSDEEEDDSVDAMVGLINDGFGFNREMFTGGLTTTDLEQLREEKKKKEKDFKEKKDKEKVTDPPEETVRRGTRNASCSTSFLDHEVVARLVYAQLAEDRQNSEIRIKEIIVDTVKAMEEALLDGILQRLRDTPLTCNHVHQSNVHDAQGLRVLTRDMSNPVNSNNPPGDNEATATVNSILASIAAAEVPNEENIPKDSALPAQLGIPTPETYNGGNTPVESSGNASARSYSQATSPSEAQKTADPPMTESSTAETDVPPTNVQPTNVPNETNNNGGSEWQKSWT